MGQDLVPQPAIVALNALQPGQLQCMIETEYGDLIGQRAHLVEDEAGFVA